MGHSHNTFREAQAVAPPDCFCLYILCSLYFALCTSFSIIFGNDIAVGINMAITVISYTPGGHSYFHTPPAFQATPSILK